MDYPTGALNNVDPYGTSTSISKGAIFDYAGSDPTIWLCPSDPSTGRNPNYMGGRTVSRARSYSMNIWMGNSAWQTGWIVFKKLSDLEAAGPTDIFLFMDERYDSINDGSFVVEMTGFNPFDSTGGQRNRGCKLVDYPSNYHRNSGVVGFIDGHIETRSWVDPRMTPPYVNGELVLNIGSPGNRDVWWLQSRATVPIP